MTAARGQVHTPDVLDVLLAWNAGDRPASASRAGRSLWVQAGVDGGPSGGLRQRQSLQPGQVGSPAALC